MSEQITPNPSVPTQVVAEVKFPKFINNLGIIPTSYKDSMSYYECLAWLCKFLEETVIPTVNENGEAVEELQNLYNELNSYVTNYFDNLDVQEEINNKLDDMVESGTLQEIIGDYLNSKAIFGFDNVEDMKEATNLIDGSYARTLGFYLKNDGGSALYKIRKINNTDLVDNMTILQMNNDNSLIAELIFEDFILVDQLGAKGDESSDDYIPINKAIQKCIETHKTLVFNSGKIYGIGEPLSLTKRININGNDSTLKALSNMQYMLYINVPNEYDGEGTDLKNRIDLLQGYEIKNIKFNCNNLAQSGIYHNAGVKIKYDTISIYKCNYSSIVAVAATESTFSNIHIYAGHSLNSIGIEMLTNDCMFNTIHMIDCHTAIKCNGFNLIDNIHAWILNEDLIDGSTFIEFGDRNSYTLNITNCYIDTYQYCFKSNKNLQNVIMSSSMILFNETIYTSSTNPVIFYADTQTPAWFFNLSKITNSLLQGPATKKLKVTNSNPSYYLLDGSNIYNNITIKNILANDLTLLNGVSNLSNGSTFQSDRNNVTLNVNILLNKSEATSVYNVYEILELPTNELIPAHNPVTFIAGIYSTADAVADPINVGYGVISINPSDKKVKIKIPTSISQNEVYIRFNVTYKTLNLTQSSFNWNSLND